MTGRTPQLRPEAPTPRRGRGARQAAFSSAPAKQNVTERQLHSLGRPEPEASQKLTLSMLPSSDHDLASARRDSLPVLVAGGSDRRRRATAPELHDLPTVHAERQRAGSKDINLDYTKAASEMSISYTDEYDELIISKSSYNLGVLTYRAVLCGEPMRRGVHRAEFTLLSGVAGVVVGVGRERLDPLTTHSVLHTEDGWGLDVLNGDLIHGPGLDVESTSWVGQTRDRDRKRDRSAGIFRQGCEGDRICLELDVDQGSLTVYRNNIFLGVLVKRGLRVLNGLARDAGGGLMWVVELARKGQSVRVNFFPSAQANDDRAVDEREKQSRLIARRASAPSAVDLKGWQHTTQAEPPTGRRQYKLRSEPLKSILKKPPRALDQEQALLPPWMPGKKMIRAADLEVASLSQHGRRRRDDYVEIGVAAERRLRQSRLDRVEE